MVDFGREEEEGRKRGENWSWGRRWEGHESGGVEELRFEQSVFRHFIPP